MRLSVEPRPVHRQGGKAGKVQGERQLGRSEPAGETGGEAHHAERRAPGDEVDDVNAAYAYGGPALAIAGLNGDSLFLIAGRFLQIDVNGDLISGSSFPED